MLRLSSASRRTTSFGSPSSTLLHRVSSPQSYELLPFGPFNSYIPRRWKKPADTAQTRLESRTLDPKLDKLMNLQRKLKMVLKVDELISNRRSHHVFVEMLSRWKGVVGLKVRVGEFLRKHPRVFEVYKHPMEKSMCCRLSREMRGLVEEEARALRESEAYAVQKVRKLLMISASGTLQVHALRLIRRELGLPDDFRESILRKHPDMFTLVDLETVRLVSRDETLAVAAVEKWREKECREKWLSEFETRHAFPIQFPTGYVIEKGEREKQRIWQRVQYINPYDTAEVDVRDRARTRGRAERFEKRAVAIIHELLSLTVEKMMPVERLAHFRKEFRIEVNVRELVLKQQGIFYVFTRDGTLTVILREAYSKGCLLEPGPIGGVRRKMLELVATGSRCTKQSVSETGSEQRVESGDEVECSSGGESGDWVVPILTGCEKVKTEQRKACHSRETSMSVEEAKEEYLE